MRVVITLLFVFSCLVLSANDKIDSLKSILSSYDREDEKKVDLLNNLGYEYWIVNPIQSIIYGQQAKALAEVLEYTPGKALSNRVIGVAHWARGSYDQGLKYLLDGLNQYRNLTDTLGEANCLMNIGLIYSDRSDNEPALKYYFDALRLFEEVQANDRSATTYVKLATIFIEEGKIDAATDFLKRAKVIHTQNGFTYGSAEVLNRYGLLKTKVREYDSANYYLKEALELSTKINDIDGITKNYLDLAEVALQLKQNKSAEELLQVALINARKIESHKWLKEIYERLQLIARGRGDLPKAVEYYDQYVKEKDSIFNEQTLNNISRLETELATAEQKRQLEAREKEFVILEQRSEIRETRLIGIIVLAVVTIVALFLSFKVRQQSARRKEEEATREAEEARKELEFKNRELVSYTVNFVQKNQLFEELIDSVSQLKKKSKDDVRKELIGMERVIKRHLQVDKDWEDFKLRFENLHSGFFDDLLKQAPSLTNNDLKLSALVKMNFSIKEVADMMGISTESVKTARYRLKKKLGLPGETNINDFLNAIG